MRVAWVHPTWRDLVVERLADDVALTRTSQRWDDAGTAVPLATLEAWFSLARRLRPSVRPPALTVTWAEFTPAAAPAPGDLPAVRRFTEWLTLCELIRDAPEGVAAGIGYGPAHVDLLEAFVVMVATELERCANGTVVRALEAVAAVSPELSARAARLVPWLREDMPAPAWLATTPMTAVDRELEAAGGYDVSRVLADL
jgi:hypothetical protein